MAKQEITLQGIDGQVDELILTTNDESSNGNLEDCARLLFPQEDETKPRLRFKGFDGEWERLKASELFVTFNERNRPDLPVLSACQDIRGMAVRSESGYDISHDRANEVTYKVVKPGQFVIHLRSFQGGFAHSSVEGITSPAYTVFGFKEPEMHDDYFWKIIFMSKEFINRLKTITYGIRDGRSISFAEFAGMDFLFPNYEEQHRIASFFRRLDKQIALHKHQFEQLEQIKSACLDSMFPKQSESAPPIRFNGYETEWITKQLSECLEISKERNTDNKYGIEDVLSVSDDYGVMNQIELLGRSYAGKSVSNYGVLKNGEIVYTKSPLRSKPFGIVKQNTGKTGIVSVLYAVYTPKEGVWPDFIHYYFDLAWRLNDYMRPLVNKGAKNTMNISDETALTGHIKIPQDISEQKQIASFFHRLDSQISNQLQQLERLKQMKTACLDSMFPKQSENTPPIRFKRFNGTWIRKSFMEIFIFLKNNSLSRAELEETGNVMNVHYGDILIKFGDIIDMNIEQLPYIKNETLANTLAASCQLQDGDVVFADAAEDNTVGKCAEILSLNDYTVVSGLHTIPCRPTLQFSEGFLGYCLNASSYHDQLLPLIQGTKISSISKKAISTTYITFPEDLEEQHRIASFFRSLDKRISLQTQQVEKLKQMKKACLKKMIA